MMGEDVSRPQLPRPVAFDLVLVAELLVLNHLRANLPFIYFQF